MTGQSSTVSREEFDALQTCAEFDIPEELCVPLAGKKYPVFMDPAGTDVLQRIAARLSAKGYEITKVKPAKGIEAGCDCRFGGSCEISVILGVDRMKTGYVSCYLITRWFAPFFLRKLKGYERPDEACFEQWMRLCGAINDVIMETFGATSAVWMTEHQMNVLARAEQKES